jgi:hypothetical protein
MVFKAARENHAVSRNAIKEEIKNYQEISKNVGQKKLLHLPACYGVTNFPYNQPVLMLEYID